MKIRVIENLTRFNEVSYDVQYYDQDRNEWIDINYAWRLDFAIAIAEEYAKKHRRPRVMWEV